MPRYTVLPLALLACLSGCNQAADGDCAGTLVEVPDGTVFTPAQLMAHGAAMGMTQQELETLIYLEGLSADATLQPGERICLDGRPD